MTKFLFHHWTPEDREKSDPANSEPSLEAAGSNRRQFGNLMAVLIHRMPGHEVKVFSILESNAPQS